MSTTNPIALVRNLSVSKPAGYALDAYKLIADAADAIIGLYQKATLTTQFDKTSSATLSNVTGLGFNVEAGKTYRLEGTFFTGSASAGGIKLAVAGTATATSVVLEVISFSGGTVGQERITALGTGSVTATVTAAFVRISGSIVVNVAGTLIPQFAQGTSNGTASSVLVGSTFEVTEIQ